MSILDEIKQRMTANKAPTPTKAGKLLRVTTAAEVPRQSTPAGGLTLGDRIKAAMPGMKPAKIDDRRQAGPESPRLALKVVHRHYN
jgi:hypothetical protein